MGYLQTIIILGGINLIAVLGLAILTGYTGLFSIGHAGFMALGGYMAAILVKEAHMPLLVALVGGGLFAGLCSFIIGYPAFRSRLRGDYFAIATLGFSEAIRLILNNVMSIPNTISMSFHGQTLFALKFMEKPIKVGGSFGYMGLPSLDTMTFLPAWLLVTILASITVYLTHMFVTSQYGKNCIAVAQDEVAAQMMGVNLLRTKLTALFVSTFFTGVAGGLMAFFFAYLTPSTFNIPRSSDLLAAVVFGGIQSIIGPAITSLVLVAVPQLLLTFAEYRLIAYGLLFVVVMIFRPQGLLGYVEMRREWLWFWKRQPAKATEK